MTHTPTVTAPLPARNAAGSRGFYARFGKSILAGVLLTLIWIGMDWVFRLIGFSIHARNWFDIFAAASCGAWMAIDSPSSKSDDLTKNP